MSVARKMKRAGERANPVRGGQDEPYGKARGDLIGTSRNSPSEALEADLDGWTYESRPEFQVFAAEHLCCGGSVGVNAR